MQFWEINLGLEDSPEFTLFFPFFKLFFWFYPLIFSYFFSTSYGIFYSFWKKKHVLPKAFFFSRFCSTFLWGFFAFGLNISIKYFLCFVPITFETRVDLNSRSRVNPSRWVFWASNGVFWIWFFQLYFFQIWSSLTWFLFLFWIFLWIYWLRIFNIWWYLRF